MESKKGQFNLINESLCSKCSNTLEESFVSTSEKHKNINFEVENSILNEKILSFQYKVNFNLIVLGKWFKKDYSRTVRLYFKTWTRK